MGASDNPAHAPRIHKYATIERERRFLLDRLPRGLDPVRVRHIADRYIDGTTLRLRKQTDRAGPTIFKLTQKIAARGKGAQQGLITSMFLTEAEFLLLTQLPGKELTKTRHSVPPFGIDVFEGRLQGLLLAEAEFRSDAAARALAIPSFIVHEVTDDHRFTGGQLVRASRRDIRKWLAGCGIGLGALHSSTHGHSP
jgi:CYTH domain-containing protein